MGAVGRVDSWLAIAQQIVYLAVIAAALAQMFLDQERPPPTTGELPALKRWYYRGRTAVVHFLFGSLLNLTPSITSRAPTGSTCSSGSSRPPASPTRS
jgi:hypothetical protein